MVVANKWQKLSAGTYPKVLHMLWRIFVVSSFAFSCSTTIADDGWNTHDYFDNVPSHLHIGKCEYFHATFFFIVTFPTELMNTKLMCSLFQRNKLYAMFSNWIRMISCFIFWQISDFDRNLTDLKSHLWCIAPIECDWVAEDNDSKSIACNFCCNIHFDSWLFFFQLARFIWHFAYSTIRVAF